MNIEEMLDWATTHEYLDLQALIMFLVYEKKTLSLSDNSEKVKFYTQEKFNDRMKDHLNDYKSKMKFTYKNNIYSIITQNQTIYTLAQSENEARYIASKASYEVRDIKTLANHEKLSQVDENGSESIVTVKELKNRITKSPSIIGGF